MKNQAGFTLIELIMVIVILGILAATAMPKFADLKGDARVSAIEGLKGSMDAALTIAHGTQLTKGLASNVDVNLAGVNVSMVNGYPDVGMSGIVAALDLSAKYAWFASGIDFTTAKFDGIGFASDRAGIASSVFDPTCYVTYTAATFSASGVLTTPITSAVTSGC